MIVKFKEINLIMLTQSGADSTLDINKLASNYQNTDTMKSILRSRSRNYIQNLMTER
jgi:hypothetical protein